MKKYILKTFGCSANHHDSELMAGMLSQSGLSPATEDGQADVVILNICTVKGDLKAIKEIRNARETNPDSRIIVTGCTTQRIIEACQGIDKDIITMSTHELDRLPDALAGKTIGPATKPVAKILLPKVRINETVGIVLISEGCTNICTFCSTKSIKGNVHSYPIEDIVEEVRRSVHAGTKEIWLTSQDNGAYGLDLYRRRALGELLSELTKIRGSFFMRVGMANPHHIKEILPQLIYALNHKNVFSFMHIPVQAGSDRVLTLMKRTYTVDDYRTIVQTLQEKVPDITIATDIIAGFPTETDEEFEETLALVRETRPQVVNISRYSIREGTKAAEMPQLPEWIKKERSRKLTLLFEEVGTEENRRWIDWEGDVIIDDEGKDGIMQGRNSSYKAVVVPGTHSIGDIVHVRIKGCTQHDLRSEVID
ncbi:MAG: tRNA (N(6)-L-threonylcarbamoyladenosine(37)-C(2))-methylthiotransferase [archaeon]